MMNEITKLDFSRLLGFASASDRLSNGVDFRDDTLGAKLGAKVGVGEAWAPCELLHADDSSDQGLA